MRAIEIHGRIDGDHRLQVDLPPSVGGPCAVRVIVLVPEDDDVSESEWLRAARTNPAFESLKEPEEDVYSATDGTPLHHEG